MPAVKRESSPTTSEGPHPPPPSKKAKSTPKSSPKKKATASPGDKKIGAWSGEELAMLYAIMNPKKTGTKWDEVSSQIPGRDAKSCNNKWTRMQKKIMEAIENTGE